MIINERYPRKAASGVFSTAVREKRNMNRKGMVIQLIKLDHIRKTFRVSKRDPGLKNALRGFVKRQYDMIEALADISFQVSDGEMVGYIGPNGAGKSSTIKVMSGILTPDSGECVIDGRIPWKQRREHVANLGVVFGQRSGLWWDVPVGDSFELLRDIYSVPADEYRKNLDRLTEMLDLRDLLKTPTRQLSLGQRMRCEIAAALIHSPKLLFLDEPTIGLDAVSKLAVRSFVSELNRERGTTVILTTHDMQDVEALAKRIILIGKGRILLDGSLSDLRHRFEGKRRLTAEFSGELDFGENQGNKLFVVPDGASLIDIQVSSGSSRAVFELDSCPVSRLVAALSEKVELTDMSVDGTSIDEIVLNMYREYGI